jgi:hypothetical protein
MDTSVPWIKALEESVIQPLYEVNKQLPPRQKDGGWSDTFEHFLGQYYGPLNHKRIENAGIHQGGVEMVVDQVLSNMQVLSKAEREEVGNRVRKFLETREDTNNQLDTLVMPYYCDVYWSRRLI